MFRRNVSLHLQGLSDVQDVTTREAKIYNKNIAGGGDGDGRCKWRWQVKYELERRYLPNHKKAYLLQTILVNEWVLPLKREMLRRRQEPNRNESDSSWTTKQENVICMTLISVSNIRLRQGTK
jgi:hypothetical protein